MAEWSKAAVLKTVKVQAFWGSNPYLRAKKSARLLGITECLAFFS